MLKKEERKQLLELCRKAIKSRLERKPIEVSQELKARFSEKKGVFVSLHTNGALRGCIGFVEPIYPLWEAVSRAAIHAAFDDARFPPLSIHELDKIKIEISILSKPELIKAKSPEEIPKQIKIGKHGLIIQKGPYTGLLLPQVFTEWQVDEKGALEMLCEKAGLPAGSWQEPDANTYFFEAEIIKE